MNLLIFNGKKIKLYKYKEYIKKYSTQIADFD